MNCDMKFRFKKIEPDFYKAKLCRIKEESGCYGEYLRFIFTITEGGLRDYSFSGIVKPVPIKQGKFYRWVTNILGKEPDSDLCAEDLIGKECLIFLSKRDKNFYSVTDVFMSCEWPSKGKNNLEFSPLF